jgi:hypothetical protein
MSESSVRWGKYVTGRVKFNRTCVNGGLRGFMFFCCKETAIECGEVRDVRRAASLVIFYDKRGVAKRRL